MKTIILSIAFITWFLINLIPFIIAYKYNIIGVILLSLPAAVFAKYIYEDILKQWNL